ncbi:pyridoxamine 5'-phosphate oxidase family protein [Streptomyces sp. A7024]|uniref:Pyridoxamine 5'-phosphate oxidase family protein n=1 Tax=Streptomyces coryli TaxID=1128680 RepID=A0A6G4UFC0_9ACTN|nr:pyridoxamine 5'-phosphate oxidase family protein [Streptomyces coryli]NGN70498.1 pyridoxamine 5'-phosphate oxidase family protein [Streptomyces coryli]
MFIRDRNVPIWYVYEPGGELWILTGNDSAKAKAAASAGRASVMAQRLEPTVRYVTVEGPVTIEPGTPEQLREVSERYLPPEAVEEYIKFSEENLSENVVIRLRPEKWLSADMGSW